MRTRALMAAGVAVASAGSVPLAVADPGSTARADAAQVRLSAMPRGTARAFVGSHGDLLVRLDLTGVTPGSRHSVDVERGMSRRAFKFRGADNPGAVATAGATGQIDQTVDTGLSAWKLRHGPLVVTIREGVAANAMGAQRALAAEGIAYARLGDRLGDAKRLRAIPTFGRTPRGRASFTYNANDPNSPTGQSITVQLRARGFQPGSTHAAHVHSGTCASQGGVVVMLPDLTADARGNLSATDTVPVDQAPQSPLYINLHQGDSNTILDANGNPTLSFRPLLCGDISGS